MALSFIICLLAFLLIGIASAFQSRHTSEDYLIASKAVPPWLVGLSAVATNNSGFMFIGMIGVTYSIGLSSIWLMIGWVAGDLMISLLVLKPLRVTSEREEIHSFGGLLAHWQGGDYLTLRRVSGLITVVFLTIYAAAQLKAGSKATEVLLEWQAWEGIVLSAAIVLVYSIAGGMRASIWTDAAQSMVMIVGMSLLCIVSVQALGGIDASLAQLHAINGYMNWFPGESGLENGLFVLGWLFGGMAVIGQPHIVIRFMSLDKADNLPRMRVYYYSWFTLFYGLTILVGLLSRVLPPDIDSFDPELALPLLSIEHLPAVLTGVVLAALFAATMSTADSLILACSASLSRDFLGRAGHSLTLTKIITFSVLLIALSIALSNQQSIFDLVLDAWGLLASAFAPLLILFALGQRISERLALSLIGVGVISFIGWNQAGLSGLIYSVAPGMLSGLLWFALVRLFGRLRTA